MEGMRGYATAIVVGFVIVALAVVGLRWHALAQHSPAPLYAYAPPAGRTGDGGGAGVQPARYQESVGGAGVPPADQAKARGVSPSKQPAKPAADPAPDSGDKPKGKHKSQHSSAPKVLPKEHSVNINTATQAQLETLPGVGPSIASRIISYRNEHGKFKTVDELDQVKGIGPKKLAKLASYCVVD